MASNSFVFSSHSLFRRCVQCPDEPPQCPSCAADEVCSQTAQSCDACPSTTCLKIGSLPGQSEPKKSTPVGSIVGGVVGGIAVLLVVLFFVWRYRKRKRAVPLWDPPEKRDQSTLSRNRQSTRSAHSIASTVLTRASNVIQIAYIPGVTVRSPPDSPGLMVPPVPSLPGGSAATSANSSPQLEQHFFMPRDLRDSTWSDASSMDPRFSMAPSLARESVASAIYRSDAVVPPIPAQHAFRAQANIVSVKSGSNTPGTSSTPSTRTPQIPQTTTMGNSSIVARTVTARPIEVKKGNSATHVPTLGNLAKQAVRRSGTPTSPDKSIPMYMDEKEVVVSSSAVTPSTISDGSPVSPLTMPKPTFANNHSARSSSISAIGHFDSSSNGSSSGPTHRHTGSSNLNAMIEDALNRARDPQNIGVASPPIRPELFKQDSGPFSDANEVKENIA